MVMIPGADGEVGWVLKQGSSLSGRKHRRDKHRVGFGQQYEAVIAENVHTDN